MYKVPGLGSRERYSELVLSSNKQQSQGETTMLPSAKISEPPRFILEVWRVHPLEATIQTSVSPEFAGDKHGVLSRFRSYYQHLRLLPRAARRRLQRCYRQSLAGAALLLALGHDQGIAATINVDASCSLINAITAANTDTVVGGCRAGSGADTIVLAPESTHVLTDVNNSTYGPTGLPVVSSEITIQGNGSTIKRGSGAPEFRLISVNPDGNLTLQQITITGGLASGEDFVGRGGGIAVDRGILSLIDSTVSGNAAGNSGGGIENYAGDLTLTRCTVAGNAAAHGGGGLENYDGTLTLNESTVVGNSAGGNGGGIDNYERSLILTNSHILDNVAALRGGGINNHGGGLTLVESMVSGNVAVHGGGIATDETNGGDGIIKSTISKNVASSCGGVYSDDGGLRLTDSTVSGNSAGGCGGICSGESFLGLTNSTVSGNSATGSGGGLCNGSYGTLRLDNSTVSGNVSGNNGGGIITRGRGSVLQMTQSTITGNVAAARGGGIDSWQDGSVELTRSLISGNTAQVGPELYNEQYAKVTSGKYNLFGLNGNAGVIGFSPKVKDIVPAAGVILNDILAPLADNTGLTMTHALVTGSPAIDAAGGYCPPPATDQRGVARPQQAACDIGAFEAVRGDAEICNNCLDDDGDGQIDLLDNSCAAKAQDLLNGALSLARNSDEDKVRVQSKFSSGGVILDPPAEGMTLSFVQEGALLACVQIPAGEGWSANKKGNGWNFRDEKNGSLGDPTKDLIHVQCNAQTQTCTVKARIQDVQLGNAQAGEITTMLVIGDDNLVNTQEWKPKAEGKKIVIP